LCAFFFFFFGFRGQARAQGVVAGDHIAAINGTDLVGSRHFEVARMLKEIPIGSEFTLKLTSPKSGMQVGQRTALAAGATKEVKPGEGRKTLRMKANGTAEVFNEVEDASLVAQNALITKIDTLLEQHIGIRDLELSRTMYNLAKDAKEADQFAGKLDEELTDFEFPDDFVLDVSGQAKQSKQAERKGGRDRRINQVDLFF
jgi:hypothetical protein